MGEVQRQLAAATGLQLVEIHIVFGIDAALESGVNRCDIGGDLRVVCLGFLDQHRFPLGWLSVLNCGLKIYRVNGVREDAMGVSKWR